MFEINYVFNKLSDALLVSCFLIDNAEFFYYDLAHKADFIDKIESYIKLYIDAKLYHVTWHEKLQTIEKLTQNRFHNEYYRSKQGFLISGLSHWCDKAV